MKRTYAWLTAFIALLSGTTAQAGQENYIADTKWYMNEECNNTSSWVNNTIAGGASNTYTSEVMYVAKKCDASTSLPVELCRKMTAVTEGVFTCEFAFSMNKSMDDTTFALVNGSEKAVYLAVRSGKLFFGSGDGNDILLCELDFSDNLDEHLYHVRINADIDTSIVKSVEVNGVTVCTDARFFCTAPQIDGFDVCTGKKSTGTFLLSYLRLYQGYEVMEGFRSKTIPDSFELSGNVRTREFNYRYQDRYSMEFDTESAPAQSIRTFAPMQGKFRVEFQMLLPEYRDGAGVAICMGDDEILMLEANGKAFEYSGERTQEFYEYRNNVWYHFTAEIDSENDIADIYLNGKLRADNVKIKDFEYIDNVKIKAEQGSGRVVTDDISVYAMRLCEDYVSEPQVVQSDDYLIGMQMCPLWTEGTMNGWSPIKSAPQREPVLGYYDEGNPEVNDWEIKQMSEHGIDFQLVCAYTCYSKEIGNRDPVKDNVFRHGNALHNGFFNAKYSDYMKFAILWENNGYRYGTQEYDDFFDNLVPFWIEYYFKDERYLTIDNRPFMSIYNPENFFALFGENKQDIKAGVKKFRDMCIEAGVGNPIIAINPGSAYSDELIDKYSECGIDFASKYNFGSDGIDIQKRHLDNMKKWNDGNAMGIIPVCVQGFNSIPWNGKGGFKASPEEYKAQLEWIKNTYAPSVNSNMLIAATWNEFGEGTVIAPTVSEGFGYLDAIREVFSQSNPHIDELPTFEQKTRITNLTVQENFNAKIVERIPGKISEQDIIKGYYFDNGTDGWVSCGDTGKIEAKGGKLLVTPSGSRPQIVLRNINADTSKVNYVKLTMKANATSSDGCVYYNTIFSGSFSENNKRHFSFINSQGMSEIYVPIANGSSYKGLLRDLKLVLGTNISDMTDIIEIESIELLGTEDTDGYISVDGYSAKCSVAEDMLSLKDIADIYDTETEYFTLDDSYTVRVGDNAFALKSGSKIMTDRYKNILLDAAPVEVNDEIYISKATAMRMFGGYISNASIRTGKIDFVDVSRENVYEYNLSATSEMSFKHALLKYYSNGTLKMIASGNDMYVKLPAFDFEANKVKRIAIGMKSSVSSKGEIYFSIDEADKFTSENVIEFPVTQSNNICEYIINTEKCSDFNGTIAQLRLDPIDTVGTVEIAYIKFLGEVDIPEIKVESKENATIVVSANDNLEYSIDAVNWQSENVFNSLAPGNYCVCWRFKDEASILGTENVVLGKEIRINPLIWDGSVDTSWYGIAIKEFVLDTPAKMAGFAQLVTSGKNFSNKKVIIGADMDFNNQILSVAGGNTKPFKGELDGAGHILFNINSVNEADADFGFVARNEGTIKNLGIDGAMFEARYGGCAGILTGRNKGVIENCFVRNSGITNNCDTMNRMGVITGRAEGGNIKNTYTCNISLEGNIPRYGFGGFVTTAENEAVIENCYAAQITTSDFDKTRIFGAFEDDSSWSECYFESGETELGTILNAGATPSDYIKENGTAMGEAYVISVGEEYNNGYPVLAWESRLWEDMPTLTASVTTSTVGDILRAKAEFMNNAENAQVVCAVIALYSGSRLISVKSESRVALPLQKTEVPVSVQMNKKADLIKIFTITDLNNSEPIGEAVLVENFN